MTNMDESKNTSFPLLPIRGRVVLPFSLTGLKIGRPQSLNAIKKVLDGDKQILVVTQRDENLAEPNGPEDFHKIGVVSRIEGLRQIAPNLIEVQVLGMHRATIESITEKEDYWLAQVTQIAAAEASAQTTEKLATLRKLVTQSTQDNGLEEGPQAYFQILIEKDDPTIVVDTIAHYLNITTPEKQGLLETISLDERIDKIGQLLQQPAAEIKDQKGHWLDPRMADNPTNRMEFGRWLATNNKYPGALSELSWCFDHGLAYDQNFYGVRLSFLLGMWAELGELYPPARAELQKRRDKLTDAVMAGSATADEALDFAALNYNLEEGAKTVAAYDALNDDDKNHQALREKIFPHIIDELLEAKRFQDIVDGSGDINETVEQIIKEEAQNQQMLSQQSQQPWYAEASENSRHQAIRLICRYYLALLGSGKYEESAEVVNQLLDFNDSPQTYVLLVQGALFANQEEAAKELISNAINTFNDSEKKTFASELEKVGIRIRVN